MRTQILSASLLALVACGGSQKTGVGAGNTPPPPPQIGTHSDVAGPGGGTATPKTEVSKDAKADYKAAMDSFNNQDKGGNWNESACRGAADKFAAVAKETARPTSSF